MEIKKIKISINREDKCFSADITINDKFVDVTQGRNYPELFYRINEVLLIRSEEAEKEE